MSQKPSATRLVCDNNVARQVHDYLTDELGVKAVTLDEGYPEIDYSRSNRRVQRDKRNKKIVCEEIWERALAKLDELGAKANWEENGNEDAIERYQKFRKFIEGTTNRAIPWVLEAPYAAGEKFQRTELSSKAQEIRKKVRDTIQKLYEILTAAKTGNQREYQRRLVVGLYWFVWFGKKVDSKEQQEMGQSLRKNGLATFLEFLEKNEGLGLGEIKKDAPIENTALQTVLDKRGLCTEQSKVLYAVLRIAGIKAVFVEPRLTVDYFAKRGELRRGDFPLQGHMASGVGIKVKGKNGKERIWILDMALGMVEADYADDYLYWELSLRHYWMNDLSIEGRDRDDKNDWEKARYSYELALQLGKDSTVYHAAGNYSALLEEHREMKPSEGLACNSSPSCAALAYQRNRWVSWIAYNYAVDIQKIDPKKGMEAYLEAIKSDPRDAAAYKGIVRILNQFGEKGEKRDAGRYWKRFVTLLEGIAKQGPFLSDMLRVALRKLVADTEFKQVIQPPLWKKVEGLSEKMEKMKIDK